MECVCVSQRASGRANKTIIKDKVVVIVDDCVRCWANGFADDVCTKAFRTDFHLSFSASGNVVACSECHGWGTEAWNANVCGARETNRLTQFINTLMMAYYDSGQFVFVVIVDVVVAGRYRSVSVSFSLCAWLLRLPHSKAHLLSYISYIILSSLKMYGATHADCRRHAYTYAAWAAVLCGWMRGMRFVHMTRYLVYVVFIYIWRECVCFGWLCVAVLNAVLWSANLHTLTRALPLRTCVCSSRK